MAEPSERSVPVKVKICEPATAVRVTVWPLSVPVIEAVPLLHGFTSGGWDFGGGAPVNARSRSQPFFFRRKTPRKPPGKEPSAGLAQRKRHVARSEAICFGGLER